MNQRQIKQEINRCKAQIKQEIIDDEYDLNSPSGKCIVAYPSGKIGVQYYGPGWIWDSDCLVILDIDTSNLDEYIDENLEDITSKREQERIKKVIANNMVESEEWQQRTVKEVKEYLDDPEAWNEQDDNEELE